MEFGVPPFRQTGEHNCVYVYIYIHIHTCMYMCVYIYISYPDMQLFFDPRSPWGWCCNVAASWSKIFHPWRTDGQCAPLTPCEARLLPSGPNFHMSFYSSSLISLRISEIMLNRPHAGKKASAHIVACARSFEQTSVQTSSVQSATRPSRQVILCLAAMMAAGYWQRQNLACSAAADSASENCKLKKKTCLHI